MDNGAVRVGSYAVENTGKPELAYVLPPLEFQVDEKGDSSQEDQKNEEDCWRLPRAEYHILGEVVILRKERGNGMRPGQKGARELRAYTMPIHEYEKLLFCGVQTHSRSYYGDRIELLRRGAFNGRESWANQQAST